MNEVITLHETRTQLATTRGVVSISGLTRYLEVELLPRSCRSIFVVRIWEDGRETVHTRIKSHRTSLPKVVRDAARKLFNA